MSYIVDLKINAVVIRRTVRQIILDLAIRRSKII